MCPKALILHFFPHCLKKHKFKAKIIKNFKTVTGKALGPKWFLRMELWDAASPVSNNHQRQVNAVPRSKRFDSEAQED